MMRFIIRGMKKLLSFLTCMSLVCYPAETISAPPIIPIQEPEQNPYDLYPWPSEKLIENVELSQCPWLSIIEWRTSVDNLYGGPSKKAKQVLNEFCYRAAKQFPQFLKKKKINLSIDFDGFHQNICLIPVSDNARDLNDLFFRFKSREKTYDADGQLNIVWGYTDFRGNITFVRNDIINKNNIINQTAVLVFVHELYHAMSWHFKVNDYYHNSAIVEETMAQEFTQFMGLGK